MHLRAHRALPSDDEAQARAYLELLTSAGRLAATPDPGLSAPSGPLSGPQRISQGHRAPTTALLGKRAMLATLIAGISVTGGVFAVAVNANQVQAAPPSRPQPVPPSPTAPVIASGLAGNASAESIEPPPEPEPTLSSVRVRHKARPKPVVAPTATWVNPLPEAAVTSCFGHRWGRLHAGVDLAAPDGTPIRAAGAGVVVTAGLAQGYGNAVLIDHGNGYLTHYGHMSVITALPGQKVAAGEVIGLEGSTGNSTGPHLHFEVHQGAYQNPIEPAGWLREHGVAIPGCAPLAVPAEPQI